MSREERYVVSGNLADDLHPTSVERPDGHILYVWEQGGTLFYAREFNDILQATTALNDGVNPRMFVSGGTVYLVYELNGQIYMRTWTVDMDPTFKTGPRIVQDSWFVADGKTMWRTSGPLPEFGRGPFEFHLDPTLIFDVASPPSPSTLQYYAGRLYAADPIQDSDIRLDPNSEPRTIIQTDLSGGGASFALSPYYSFIDGYNFYRFEAAQGGFIRLNSLPLASPSLDIVNPVPAGLYGYTWILREGNKPWQYKESPLKVFLLYPGDIMYAHITGAEKAPLGDGLPSFSTLQYDIFSRTVLDAADIADNPSLSITQYELLLSAMSEPNKIADIFSIVSSQYEVVPV